MGAINIFSPESVDALKKKLGTTFQEYHSQRTDIDESYEVANWMYNGGSSRGVFDEERRTWVSRAPEGKSNIGSVLAHRQVNTLGGILGSILLSGRDLWRFTDTPVGGSPMARETGVATADQMNALSKWIQKNDEFDRKIPEFCISVFKQSNIFAMIAMKNEERNIMETDMVGRDIGMRDEQGNPIFQYDAKASFKKKYCYQFPTVTFPYPRNIYADRFIPRIKDQETVFVLSQTTRSALLREGKYLDKELIAQTDWTKYEWDGNYGGEGKKEDEDQKGRTSFNPRGLLLRWDVYARIPVKNGEYFDGTSEDSENIESKLVWLVFIGNNIDESVCIKAIDNFDPDDEIPITEIRASPDNCDLLYHTFLTDVIRPSYAADCALINTAVDMNCVAGDPPLLINDTGHTIKDFTLKSGQRWHVTRPDAITQWESKDISAQTVMLREQIRNDSKMALATDDAKIGQYAGARTSASEVLRVTASTDTTIALRNAYIVGQLLPWLARKYISYCRNFMEPETVRRILGEVIYPAPKSEIVGEYDVVVDIVGQYEDDMQREVGLDRMMQVLANPQFMESKTHQLNVGELVKMYVEHKRLPVSRLIGGPNTADSEANARQRIQMMLLMGEYIPPAEGENTDVHLRIARAERLRWAGLEQSDDARAKNLPLIDRYIQDLKSAAPQSQPSAPQSLQESIPTPGQENGQMIAGELGMAAGGI